MLALPWPIALSLASLSGGLAVLLLRMMRDRLARMQDRPGPMAAARTVPMAFLFRNDRLIDATEPARRLLASGPRQMRTADRLKAVLTPLFPELGDRLRDIAEGGTEVLRDSASGATLVAGRIGGTLRLTIDNLPPTRLPPEIEPATLDSLDRELDLLQGTLDNAPVLIWREDAEGAVRWANRAYLDLAAERAQAPELPGWPLPILFGDHGLHEGADDTPRRRSLPASGTAPARCFDVMMHRGRAQATFFAVPADRLHQAERSLHDFVQTLSRTFADLPTGLAIFDRDRRLALFNPALTDLTALEPIYLATRPHLSDFLDALRNRQRMPEPKNYSSWRDRIATLEQAAEQGNYLEDWSLPTGRTYRVTGQPHPNGSIAFLFEDISAEVSLTRSFREELELGQSVIDAVEDAIAVFSTKGTLVLTNSAYKRLWGNDPVAGIDIVTARDALAHWDRECKTGPEWAGFRPAVLGETRDGVCDFALQLVSGRMLDCRVTPLPGHAVMVAFRSRRPGGLQPDSGWVAEPKGDNIRTLGL